MVYTGKPSRGCQMCKSRRIKCDEKRPICGQCQKSGRVCPGYPDEFDLVFRDENKAMERKARKASGSSKTVSSQQGSPSSLSSGSISEVSPGSSPRGVAETLSSRSSIDLGQDSQLVTLPHNAPSFNSEDFSTFLWNLEHGMSPNITLPPEVEAVPFFFKNFVPLPQQADSMRGYLELLVPVYNKTRPSSALHLAINAVALATYGNYPGRARLLQEAATTYGTALRKLNDDLKDPVASRSNDSILTTLLFSLYETIMSTDATIIAWGNHVDGAVTLTKLRGTDQFKDPISRDIFRAVRTMMITSCVQRSKPIESFPGQKGWIANDINEENAANRLTLICMDLPNIRARANALAGTDFDAAQELEARDILEFAQMVDTNLQQWYDTLPNEWHYRTVGMQYDIPEDLATAETWQGPLHVYQDVPLASIVNDYRVCRIFCQRVIMACTTWLSYGGNYPVAQAYNSAIFIVQKMVDEISACVKFHLTYDMQPVAQELGLEPNAAEAFGGYSLVWPLYVAANAETVLQPQRDWLMGRLTVIGNHFGLSSAQILVVARRHVLTCGPMFP
ncbi:hypothetical protein B0J11DRAFT_552246 [Dendryphion nanum]|uniref:Zn(2)-C6 fungal-type domain-containing protein n=1 Tax=Dendryphion nanum TaxID=256645 RepID=A0A9P9DGZ7_9PLEO|nr:hypothetical protein B0J11DRAFT_552246 [Dendryphion nanum]